MMQLEFPGMERPLSPRQVYQRWESELCAYWGAVADSFPPEAIGPDGLTWEQLAPYSFPSFEQWRAARYQA